MWFCAVLLRRGGVSRQAVRENWKRPESASLRPALLPEADVAAQQVVAGLLRSSVRLAAVATGKLRPTSVRTLKPQDCRWRKAGYRPRHPRATLRGGAERSPTGAGRSSDGPQGQEARGAAHPSRAPHDGADLGGRAGSIGPRSCVHRIDPGRGPSHPQEHRGPP